MTTPLIWYKFDVSSKDKVTNAGSGGTAYDAALMNGAVVDKSDSTVGPVSGPMSLNIQNSSKLSGDATGQYMSIPSLTLGGNFTVSCWFKKTSPTEVFARLFDFSLANEGSKLLTVAFESTNGKLILGRNDKNSVANYPITTTSYCDGKWHHVVIIYDGTNFIVYIDNVVANTIKAPGIEAVSRPNNYLGRSSYKADSYSTINIDDFRIYTTNISSADVKTLFEYRKTSSNWLVNYYNNNTKLSIFILILLICGIIAFVLWLRSDRY